VRYTITAEIVKWIQMTFTSVLLSEVSVVQNYRVKSQLQLQLQRCRFTCAQNL